MADETTNVFMPEGGVVDIDANRIAAIVFDACHTSETNATRAANRIIEYLIDVFNDARMRSQQ